MMKVKLLKNARISHKAGEIVEVSPTEYAFLTSLGSAVDAVAEERKVETPEEEKPKKVTVRKKK
jgi:hypothetical protein